MITSKVKKISKGISKKVYDIVGIPNSNFVCNSSVVTHNCDEAIRFACLANRTLIKLPKSFVKIEELAGKENIEIVTFNTKTQKEEIKKAGKCIETGTRTLYELETVCGKKIKATKDHLFLTQNGWKELQELSEGDDIIGI